MAESLVALMAMLETTAATAAPAAATAGGLMAMPSMAAGVGSMLGPAAAGAGLGAAAGSGLGSAILNSFLTAGAAKAGSGLVGELFPQNQMPRPPNLGLLSAPMALDFGVPSYKRVQGNLVIPQGGPKMGEMGPPAPVIGPTELAKLVEILRQRGMM